MGTLPFWAPTFSGSLSCAGSQGARSRTSGPFHWALGVTVLQLGSGQRPRRHVHVWGQRQAQTHRVPAPQSLLGMAGHSDLQRQLEKKMVCHLKSLSVAVWRPEVRPSAVTETTWTGGRCRATQIHCYLQGGWLLTSPSLKNWLMSFLEVSVDNVCDKLASEAQVSLGI